MDKDVVDKIDKKIDKKVYNICCVFLSKKKINYDTNFFKFKTLDEIKTLINDIERRAGISIVEKKFFYKEPTVKNLAYLLKESCINNFSEIKGGVPLTEIGEWFMGNKKLDYTAPLLIKIEDIDIRNIQKIIKEISKISKTKIKYLFYSKKTKRWFKNIVSANLKIKIENIKEKKGLNKIIKIINLPRTAILEFSILKNNNDYYFLFNFNKNKLSFKEFRFILERVQNFYNLSLAGIENDYLHYIDNQKIYTPQIKTRNFYNCFHSGILFLLKHIKKDLFFYKSLFPALDLTSLPNLYFYNKNVIFSSFNNSLIAGHGNIYKKTGLVINRKYLINKKEAEKYYKKNAQANKPILLKGSVKELFFAKKYNVPENILLKNISIFYPRLNNNPIIHSYDYSYFGEISVEAFWKFWEIKEAENINKLNKEKREDSGKFFVIEIDKSSKIISHNYQMLLGALKINIREYFKGQIIFRNESKIKSDVYLGKSAYKKFKEIVNNSLVNRHFVADIVLLDLTKRLFRPILLLRDMLEELNNEVNIFEDDISSIDKIVLLWDDIFNFLSERKNLKKIDFKTSVIALPNKSLYKYKFLVKKDKEFLLKVLNNIVDKHDKLMKNLENKVVDLI